MTKDKLEEMVARAIYDECRIIEQESNGGEIRSPFATLTDKERKEMCRLAAAALDASGLIAEVERLREALDYIIRQDGYTLDGFIDWQRCVDRIQDKARAALQPSDTGATG